MKKNNLINRALGKPVEDEFANQPIAQDSAFPLPAAEPSSDVPPQEVLDLLGLVVENPPSLATIATWKPEERDAVAMWAGREHLAASDNDDVPRLPRPAVLDAVKTESSPESDGPRSDVSSPAEEEALRTLDAKLNPRFEEWHVTVENGNPVHWDYVCRMYGIDPLFIELSDFRLQLLCTMRTPPTEPVAGEGSPTFLDLCTLEGFTVIRIKHEVSALRDGEVALYYESHLKLDGPFRLDRKDASRDLYRANRWYRTKRSAQPFDAQEWGGIATSQSKPSKAVGLEYEAVLVDTNVALDAGWL
jgi:hypothetical protein